MTASALIHANVNAMLTETSLLDSIIEQSKVATNEQEKIYTRDLIEELVSQVLAGSVTVSRDLTASIDARIAELDELISTQLNAIMHHPDFQKLEASWRGLKYLTDQSETSTQLKIKVLNASKKDLVKDFKASSEFDQSALFKKIYEEEYGSFGGAPYAGLIGDYEFTRHPEDFFLIEELSHVAASAHAPLITAAGPQLFGLESFTNIGKPRDLSKIFDTVEYAKWKSFRESEDARYVGLLLPHVLGRLPYGAKTVPVEAFQFEEDVDGADHCKYLWTNAAYAFGARMTGAFSEYGWLAAIRGVEGGGLVEALPTHTFTTQVKSHSSAQPKSPSPIATKNCCLTWVSSRWCIVRILITQPSLAANLFKSPKATTPMQPTPMHGSPPNSLTSLPYRVSRIT